MSNDEIKIVVSDNKIITLKELFEGNEKTHKEQAKLPFEEKIKILVSLQKIAYSCGEKRDIIVWKI
jgi:hypothetical protein